MFEITIFENILENVNLIINYSLLILKLFPYLCTSIRDFKQKYTENERVN